MVTTCKLERAALLLVPWSPHTLPLLSHLGRTRGKNWETFMWQMLNKFMQQNSFWLSDKSQLLPHFTRERKGCVRGRDVNQCTNYPEGTRKGFRNYWEKFKGLQQRPATGPPMAMNRRAYPSFARLITCQKKRKKYLTNILLVCRKLKLPQKDRGVLKSNQ